MDETNLFRVKKSTGIGMKKETFRLAGNGKGERENVTEIKEIWFRGSRGVVVDDRNLVSTRRGMASAREFFRNFSHTALGCTSLFHCLGRCLGEWRKSYGHCR